MEIKNLVTETRNSKTMYIDTMSIKETNNDVALAIVMIKTAQDKEAAAKLLSAHHGRVGEVLNKK